MSFDLKKEHMIIIALANPLIFGFTFVGIAFINDMDDYLLFVFKNDKVVFKKMYKKMAWAKRSFRKRFAKEPEDVPEWLDIAHCRNIADKKEIQSMAVLLANPKTFNFTYVGIGCAEGHDDYLLVAFREYKPVFEKVFKSLNSAKRGFRKIVSKEIKARARWLDFAVTTKHEDTNTKGKGGIRFVKKL